MVYICILNLIYNYVSRILLWTTFEFSAFWCSNWTYNVDFMKHVVVCFNLNLSIFVKQLLSEDHDCGLILWKSKIFFTNFHEPKKLGCDLDFENIEFFVNYLGEKTGQHVASEWAIWVVHALFFVLHVFILFFLSMHFCLGIYLSLRHLYCCWGSL